MSQNARFYSEKMAQQRAARESDRPLRKQLDYLFNVVRQCEFRWELDRRA